ncbi:MAG: hypothetical protein U0790_12295 [Isosphaeraceae bacterium]
MLERPLEHLPATLKASRRGAGGAEALAIARDLCLEHQGDIKMNAIVAGPEGLVAARYAEQEKPNTLYVVSGQDRWRGGALIASEPLDDGSGWIRVEPSTLVRADENIVRTEPLDLPPTARATGQRPQAARGSLRQPDDVPGTRSRASIS